MGNRLTSAWRAGRRRWIWPAAGTVVVVLLAAGVIRAFTADAAEHPAAVATVRADRGSVTSQVATTGTVQPAQTRSLSFSVAGAVERIAVRAGTVVTSGQELARVDDADAVAAVDSAEDALAEAESTLTEARDNAGEASEAGGCGAGNRPAAYVASAPTGSPGPGGGATVSPTATAAPTRTTAPTRTASPRTASPTRGATTGGGAPAQPDPGSSAGCSTGEQPGGSGTDAVLTAHQRVNQATRTLQDARDALDGTVITAPIAGRVLTVGGKVGSQLGAGETFITLADVHDMQISAQFPEADADRLKVRQTATVALANHAGGDFAATIVQVDPVGTSDGTMVRYGVLLSFTDAPQDLLVGQSAAVRVTTGEIPDALRVPGAAVHDVAGGAGTVLRAAGDTTERIRVGVGLRGDQYTEITSGLSAGDVVVRSW